MKMYLNQTPIFSICEPYLTYAMKRIKNFETRSYPFPKSIKGTVLLHKPKRIMDVPDFFKGKTETDITNRGCIVAIAELTECIQITDEFIKSLSPEELNSGFYFIGRYAWRLENVRYIKPIEMRGHQGFWYYTGKVEVY